MLVSGNETRADRGASQHLEYYGGTDKGIIRI
jgi:hypothetical protein